MTITGPTTDNEVISKECLQVHVQFVTNRCVAACVDAREKPEWPPHPGRFYMALAAAYFETDGAETEKLAERRTLDWLANLPAPRIRAVEAEERTSVGCYVPVNDAPSPSSAMLQSAPGMPRSRQLRTFPTTIPQRPTDQSESSADVIYEWPNPEGLPEHQAALERLCRQVIRIGHSSSLVMVWIETGPVDGFDDNWEPSNSSTELACRIAVTGELERLQAACRADEIDLFARLITEIEEAPKGKAQAAAKKRFNELLGYPYKAHLRPPEPTPATLGAWQGYRQMKADESQHSELHENSYFEREMLMLTKLDGPMLNVERTLGLTQALRLALIKSHGQVEIPAWLSGHDPYGSPTSLPHAAFLAIPFAGFEHADGHLMGLAIALPRGISVAERGRWLGPLLVEQETGDLAKPVLKLWGRDLPDWTIQLEERPSPPVMLQNKTWTKPSTTWASVTPVVLDKFPKISRGDDRAAWFTEVTGMIKLACTRAGLPEPMQVDIDTTAWQSGVPRATAKSRPVRGGSASDQTAPFGDGFPLLARKPSRPAKPQTHVWLRFDREVAGPVLIGAGRFTGYGLFLPYPVNR